MKRFKTLLIFVLTLTIALPAFSADRVDSKIRFNDLYGEVSIRPDSEDDDAYEYAELDTIIYEDDRIRTKEESGAILGLEDMSTYVIKPESELIIHTEEGNVSKIEMLAGCIWGNIKKMSEGKSIEIEMSQCVAGINGTTIRCTTTNKGNTNIIDVTKGLIKVTSKITGETASVRQGQSITINNRGQMDVSEKDNSNIKKDLEDSFNKMNEKLDESQLLDKLQGQIKEINRVNETLDTALNTMRQAQQTKSIEELKESIPSYNKYVESGERFKGIFEEVNSSIKTLENKIKNNKSSKNNIYSNVISDAKTAMGHLNQSVLKIINFISELNKKFKAKNTSQQNTYAAEISNTLSDINKDADDIIKDISNESSYSDIKNAISNCETLLRDLNKINLKDQSIAGTGLEKQYAVVYNKIEKAIQKFSSVPEIKTASLKQMSDFDKEIPSFASDIRKYLSEYKSVDSPSTPVDAQKRYVQSVTRILASYDRMRRYYTKANRLYIQIEKEFRQSEVKTAEYYEVKESWEKIEQAMTEIDSEASELSSCVENLKNQLEGLLSK